MCMSLSAKQCKLSSVRKNQHNEMLVVWLYILFIVYWTSDLGIFSCKADWFYFSTLMVYFDRIVTVSSLPRSLLWVWHAGKPTERIIFCCQFCHAFRILVLAPCLQWTASPAVHANAKVAQLKCHC